MNACACDDDVVVLLQMLNPFEVCEWHPTDVIADMNTAPVAYGFGNLNFGTFVYGKEVGTRAIGRRFGIDNTLCDDGFGTRGVAMVETACIDACYEGDQQCHQTGVESCLAHPYSLTKRT